MKMKRAASLAGVGFCGKPYNDRPHTHWPDTHTKLWSLDCKFASCFWLFCSSDYWWDQALVFYKTGFLRLCLTLRDSIFHAAFDSPLSADTEAGWPWWRHKQHLLSVSKRDAQADKAFNSKSKMGAELYICQYKLGPCELVGTLKSYQGN